MQNANYFDYDSVQFHDDLAEEDRREEFWAAGQWKPVIIGLMGIAALGAVVAVPRNEAVYVNWLLGVIAGNVAITMSGNRVWERLLAGTAGIWLFMSGFVQSLYQGNAWQQSDVAVGLALIIAAASAFIRLRQDWAAHRPHAL